MRLTEGERGAQLTSVMWIKELSIKEEVTMQMFLFNPIILHRTEIEADSTGLQKHPPIASGFWIGPHAIDWTSILHLT